MRRTIQDIIARLLLAALIFGSTSTTRKRWINRHIIENYRNEGRNFIIGLWHNNIATFMAIHGHWGMHVLISQSRDGENIARAASWFGLHTVRGSSTHGALGGLRTIYKLLARGASATITPDGPLGPRYVLKPGIVALARRTGVPIVPMAGAASRMLEFKSWDRMKLPLPFSRVVMYVGDPVWIGGEEPEEEAVQKVQLALRRAEVIADAMVEGGRVAREPLLAAAAESIASARPRT